MLNNYFLILELSRYLKSNITNQLITGVFSQEKNKLVISLSNNMSLEFSADRDLAYAVLKSGFSKTNRNYVDLFPELYGRKINNIFIIEGERAIIFELSGDFKLLFSFIPSKSNLFILQNDIITNAFKNKSQYPEKTFSQIFIKKVNRDLKPVDTVIDYFKKKYFLYGTVCFNHILNNLNINEKTVLRDDLSSRIDTEFGKLEKLLSVPEFILYKKQDEIIPSLINLNLTGNYEKLYFDNVNELINGYLKNYYQSGQLADVKSKLTRKFKKNLNNVDKKIKSINTQLVNSEGSVIFKMYGEIILSNSYDIKKGDKIYEYFDETTGKKIRISLNPALSYAGNAQDYFEKYKRQKNSVSLLREKFKSLTAEKKELESKLYDIEHNKEIKELKKMEKKETSVKDSETSALFRKFIIDDRFEVWVGKSSASNDLLTMKYSGQNDLWFHVRGASGSHTVLKKNNKNDMPDKKIIEIAASIAAYYSKARNALNVPVAFCERKFVKKRKGFKEGSVVMEREKVIFVKPVLPENI